jgi:hypothetical protein
VAGFDTFWNQAAPILSLDVAKLARREELGSELQFSKAPPIVAGVQRLIRSIVPEHAQVVPDPLWAELTRGLQRFGEICSEIITFNPSQTNPVEQRNIFERDLEHQYSEIFSNLSLASTTTTAAAETEIFEVRLTQIEKSLAEKFSGIAQDAEKKAYEAEKTFNDVMDKAKSESETSADAIKKLLEETRTRAAEVISTKEAKHFQLASEEFQRSSKRWLIATTSGIAFLFVLAAAALILAETGHYANMGTSSTAQIALAKLILFSVVGYITAQAAKNFFAAKHNEAVNKHRQNAILAYRALVEATGAPEHRDIVLTHAASAVFTPQDTAFIKSGTSPSDIPATFINSVTKAVSPGSA